MTDIPLSKNVLTLAKQSYFARDKQVRLLLLGILAGFIILFLFAFKILQKSTDFVPLHYTIFFGIDLVASKWNVLVFPLVGFLVAIINSFLAWVSYKPFKFAAILFLWSSFIGEFLLIFGLFLVSFVALPA